MLHNECFSLVKIVIPKSAVSLGRCCFGACSSFTFCVFHYPFFFVVNWTESFWWMFSFGKKKMPILDSVDSIWMSAFKWYKAMKELIVFSSLDLKYFLHWSKYRCYTTLILIRYHINTIHSFLINIGFILWRYNQF